jgi:hypothetical protein
VGPTSINGATGLANDKDADPSPTPARAIQETSTIASETFIAAGDAGNGETPQSISPLQLEQALQ